MAEKRGDESHGPYLHAQRHAEVQLLDGVAELAPDDGFPRPALPLLDEVEDDDGGAVAAEQVGEMLLGVRGRV